MKKHRPKPKPTRKLKPATQGRVAAPNGGPSLSPREGPARPNAASTAPRAGLFSRLKLPGWLGRLRARFTTAR